MAFEAEIIKDSLLSNGVRLTTAKLTFPRSILAEFNTHRMFSRNAASSRAIPVEKMLAQIEHDPFIPEFRKNSKGMQGFEELKDNVQRSAKTAWLSAAEHMVHVAEVMSDKDTLNIHKQYVNRLLEPWMWATVVVTATDWDNMFAQRVHEMAEPSFNKIATMLKKAMKLSEPKELKSHEWHMPYVPQSEIVDLGQEYDLYTGDISRSISHSEVFEYLREKLGENNFCYPSARYVNRFWQDVSVGRLAKLSYNNLETGKVDVLNDIRLAVQLSMARPGHWSPFEHVARQASEHEMVYNINQLTVDIEIDKGTTIYRLVPLPGELGYCGNFKGAFQYRKEFSHENLEGSVNV